CTASCTCFPPGATSSGTSGPSLQVSTIKGKLQSGVQLGMPVAVRDLVATPWENEGRHGIAFRAAEIRPLNAPAPAGKGAAQ
ncbi:hypothetical protein ACIBL8_28965, partial [Streptomyces sp. NPDC050523]